MHGEGIGEFEMLMEDRGNGGWVGGWNGRRVGRRMEAFVDKPVGK